MSIVTKIFVVLAAILAVFILPLMVAFVNNNAELRKELEGTQQQYDVARKEADIVNATNSRLAQRVADALEDANDIRQAKAGQINELMTENAQLRAQIVDLESRLAGIDAQNTMLSAGNEQYGEIIEMLENDLEKKRAAIVKANKQNVELTDRNQDLTVRLDTMREQVRLLKENLASAREQIVELEQRQGQQPVARGDDQEVRPVPTVHPIRGVVTGVQQVDGETFVSVNVGTNDQVAEGMEFIIHKGSQYVGSMKVTNVDLNSAAGRVTLSRGEVRKQLEVLASNF